MLQKSVLSDINDENVYQEIVAQAIIGKIITTPFMTLDCYAKCSGFDLRPE
jgi:hypothetical protein